MTDQTPNLGLERIPADQKIWADKMNNNLSLIDAAVGAYFFLNNLQGVWLNSHEYLVGQAVVDPDTGTVWTCQYQHISAMIPTTFLEDRTAHPTYWSVYSAPARARGAWTGPGTTYGVNDFVVAGPKYAVCIQAHTSTANFDNDVTSGYWSVLVDLSAAGSQVLPVPGGAADANKVVVVPPSGNGYTIIDGAALPAILGASSIGEAVFKAASQSDARTAIGAQVAGSYQAANATLTALTGSPTTAFGIALLALATAADLRATAGLGTAAVLNVGTRANQVVQLDGSAKLPAVDGSALTGVWDTGDLKITMRSTAGAGWIKVDDGTIGSSASAATTRANDDTLNLYKFLYDSCSDALCPVSGGRGVSAAADFAANKTLRLTKMLGRALVIAGAGSGLTARTLGDIAGAETHNHGGATGASGTVAPVTGGGGSAAAGGHVHSIPSGDSMQPSTFVNVFIRL